MIETTDTTPTWAGWIPAALTVLVNIPLFWWIIRSCRRTSRKSNVKRRLLVKDADGLPVWHTVRGRVLLGWLDNDSNVTSGNYADGNEWAVVRAANGKLVVYRFDKHVPDQPKTGVIQIYDSWPSLESAVPASIFEQALLEAGIKKPNEYREVPLKL